MTGPIVKPGQTMSQRWEIMRCLDEAKHLAEEMFVHLHKDTPGKSLCGSVLVLFNAELNLLCLKFDMMSATWTRHFLRTLNHSCKQRKMTIKPLVSDEVQAENQLNLKDLNSCMQHKHNISDDRVWNADETVVRMVGTGKQSSSNFIHQPNIMVLPSR